jgi:hypothetical protein
MHGKLLAIIFLLLSSEFSFVEAAGTNTISLKKIHESATTVDFALEATQIETALIGISTTIKLGDNIQYQSFEKGTFFEKNSANITYLGSPRKTNNQEIIIGIVSLEEQSSPLASGTIITLHCSKSTPNPALAVLQNSVASGVANNQRRDYSTITWTSLPKALPNSGSRISWIIICSLVLTGSFHARIWWRGRSRT